MLSRTVLRKKQKAARKHVASFPGGSTGMLHPGGKGGLASGLCVPAFRRVCSEQGLCLVWITDQYFVCAGFETAASTSSFSSTPSHIGQATSNIKCTKYHGFKPPFLNPHPPPPPGFLPQEGPAGGWQACPILIVCFVMTIPKKRFGCLNISQTQPRRGFLPHKGKRSVHCVWTAG